jgi:ribosomal protein S18 acetylase RimI-like enzyme
VTAQIRQATVNDIPHLARFQTEAYGGYNEILYDGLVPGQSIESLVQSRFTQADTVPFYENHWVAMCEDQVAGGIHSFAMKDMEKFPRDPLVPEARHAIAEEYLHYLPAPDTYYIHALTVYPEFRGKGIASLLLSLGLKHANDEGFTECSLYVFAENTPAVALYRKHKFKVANRWLVTEHPLLYYSGDMLLMTCAAPHYDELTRER